MPRLGPAAALTSSALRLRMLVSLDPVGFLDVIGRAYRNRPLLCPSEPLPYHGFGGAELTGGQLRQLGYRLAQVLRGQGLRTNTRVVVATGNHPAYLIHLHAMILAGVIPVSINAGTGWDFMVAVARHTGAEAILTDADTLALADSQQVAALRADGVRLYTTGPAGAGPGSDMATDLVPLVAAVAEDPSEVPRRRVGDDTVLAIFHTSGTTGTPKLCVWTARNSRRIWQIMMATLPVGAHTRMLFAVPYSHALFFALGTGVLLCGVRAHALCRLEAEPFLAAIGQTRATAVFAFPHLYMRAVTGGLEQHDIDTVKIWATGADKAHAAHIAQLIRRGGLRLLPWRPKGSIFLDSYGSTEIGAGGIMQLWLPGSAPQPCVQGRGMPTQFGFRIVDKSWRDVPDGTEGRILVRSTTAFAGYWNNHDVWAASRIDGWWWAGDVGRKDSRGRLLFLDREADSVHTPEGLVRTLPLEERLLAHPTVMEAAVFQAGSGGTGRAVALVAIRGAVTRADLAQSVVDLPALEAELLDWANQAQRPGPALSQVRVVALEEIPFGVTGKVLKTRLRTAAGQEWFDQAAPAVAERSAT